MNKLSIAGTLLLFISITGLADPVDDFIKAAQTAQHNPEQDCNELYDTAMNYQQTNFCANHSLTFNPNNANAQIDQASACESAVTYVLSACTTKEINFGSLDNFSAPNLTARSQSSDNTTDNSQPLVTQPLITNEPNTMVTPTNITGSNPIQPFNFSNNATQPH
ncbi:MAG: hypothetical protein A3F17_05205 [Gammaproteobacteria bacterium RIFCSPHIGHO2_12_FULL_41_15]|nr:MAG: hypothetical protein A3F17_05205 [Gammaproteobacteria bacterium RIFCSPHIGHO2_12_FULL_41_15]